VRVGPSPAALLLSLVLTGLSGALPAAAQNKLAPLLAALSPAGSSILAAALERDNAEMMTSPTTANFALWSQFAARGWMVAQDAPMGGPIGQSFKMFKLTNDGQRSIPAVLNSGRQP
jgi:hypothetical protein